VIIPEIEAIDTDMLLELEKEGWNVIPNAAATKICMNRKLIREKIAREARVLTSKYAYAKTDDYDGFKKAVESIGYPCLSKAIMSSSGKGTYLIQQKDDIEKAMKWAVADARGSGREVIIEEVIDFDTEVTELTFRHLSDSGEKVVTSFCKPVGHYQIDGDYHSSWQGPETKEYLPFGPFKEKIEPDLAAEAERKIYEAAGRITAALGGVGIFGVELFVKVKDGEVLVYGNECSPRPHDTGMVTYISHLSGFSEGGLHLKAILGRPISVLEKINGFSVIQSGTAAATHVFKLPKVFKGTNTGLEYKGISEALKIPGVDIYHFGKPFADHAEDKEKGRVAEERMGIALAVASNVSEAIERAEKAAHLIEIKSKQHPIWERQDEFRKHIFGTND
jgi:phosphoribosylglycinamide formyltransferase 2